MNIRYIAHSSFLIRSTKGTTIVTDPFGSSINYPFPDINADIALISHEHPDHNASWRLKGTPVIVKRSSDFPMEQEVQIPRTGEQFTFNGVPTYHDDYSGRRKGPNTSWVWHIEGVRYCFLGDIGHILNQQQMDALGGDCDILFLPVGGQTTVGATEAALIISQLSPKLVFPMHYKTDKIAYANLASDPLEKFLDKMDNVEHTYSMAIDIDLARLPRHTKIIVLKYE